jgi:hypothetical protein
MPENNEILFRDTKEIEGIPQTTKVIRLLSVVTSSWGL